MVWLVCCIAWKMPHWEANEHTQSNWVEYAESADLYKNAGL